MIQFAGKNALIDGGESYAGSTVSSYLRDRGISKIDLMIATHSHSDHIGGLITILKDFEVKRVLDSGEVHTSKTYETYLDLIDKKNISHSIVETGQTIDFDSAIKIDVLSPTKTRSNNPDDDSVVLKVTYGNISFLLMGDAGFETENRLLGSSCDLKSDVLKVANHGSEQATSSDFLSKVSPDIAIIEVGMYNVYGYPSPKVLGALQALGSKIYRTDLDGDIIVTTDGTTYSVATQKIPEHTGSSARSIEHVSKSDNTVKATTSSQFEDFSIPNLPNAWR